MTDEFSDGENKRMVQELEAKVQSARMTENTLIDLLAKTEIEVDDPRYELHMSQFMMEDLGEEEALYKKVRSHIRQLEFEATNLQRVDRANARTRVEPDSSPSWTTMAMMPLAALAMILLSFGLLAVRGVPAKPSLPVN
jgi:hypothetical protein